MLEFYDPRLDRRSRYRTLRAGDPYFATASVAYLVCERLEPDDQEAFLYGVAEDWPTTQGRHGDRYRDFRSTFVYRQHEKGWTIPMLAAAWDYSEEEVRRWLRHAEQLIEEQERLGEKPRIEVVEGEVPTLARWLKVQVPPKIESRRRETAARTSNLPELLGIPPAFAAFVEAWGPPGNIKQIPARPGASARKKLSFGPRSRPD